MDDRLDMNSEIRESIWVYGDGYWQTIPIERVVIECRELMRTGRDHQVKKSWQMILPIKEAK